MLISGIITFAWLIKPAIGYIIDNFLNKRVWILISLSCSTVLAAVIGSRHLQLVFLIGMLITSSAWAAFRDVSVDGIMCVEGKKYSATGKIQSVQWISISVATLITGIGGGYIAERWDYTTGYLCLIPIYIIAAAFAYFYDTKEPLRTETPSKFIQDMKTLFGSRRLMWAGLFVFLYQFAPSFGTPLLFIQKDVFKWSKIWIGTLGTIGTVFAVIGALLYFKFSQRINIRKWLLFSVFLGAVTTLSYLHYTPTTAVVYDIVYSLLGMFVFLLILDFMARNSVEGLEAASFALLTSLSNLALVSSNMCGALLLPHIGLQGLIVLSALASFLCLFIIPKIIV